MSDLLSAITAASRDYAQPIAAAYASANRVYTGKLYRPGTPGTFNRDTGVFDKRERTVVYTGPARIFPSGETTKEVGDEVIPFNLVTITLDYFTADNAPDPALVPRRDDIFVVDDSAASEQGHLPSRVFEVTGVNVGGQIGVGWRLEAEGAATSRQDPG